MNMHSRVTDVSSVNMTSKGQVLIPKRIRDRLGLVPGRPVRVGLNDRGEAVVLPAIDEETREQRRARITAAIEAVAGKYSFGGSTDEYMAIIREPYEELP